MEYHIYKQLFIMHLRKVIFYKNLRLYPWLTTNAPVEELLLEFECNPRPNIWPQGWDMYKSEVKTSKSYFKTVKNINEPWNKFSSIKRSQFWVSKPIQFCSRVNFCAKKLNAGLFDSIPRIYMIERTLTRE